MDMKELDKKELNQEEMDQISGAGYKRLNKKGQLAVQVRIMINKGFSVESIINNIRAFAVNDGYIAQKGQADLAELDSFIRGIYGSATGGM